MPKEIVCAIDVGTTKICALIAAVTHDNLGNLALNLLGSGVVPSRGIRRGVVMDVPLATAAIGEAVEQAEQAADQQMTSAYVGIAGSHIQTFNSRGISPVDQGQGVSIADMQRALDAAKAISLPQNREVIHTIARSWIVDEQKDVQQPLGMSAYRLEVDAHIVTGSSTAVNNLVQCILAHGIDIDELVLEPLASGGAVLTPEERQMGVVLADIGGGTTDLAVFTHDGLRHTVVLDLGGNHMTNDVAMGLRAPFETAEELKLRYGHAVPDRIAEDEMVRARVFGEQGEMSFSRQFISQILEARAEETCEIIRKKLKEADFGETLPAGVVLTGGSSLLPGLTQLSRRVFNMPVRIGSPGGQLPIRGMTRELQSPIFATGVGLLIWGMNEDARAIHKRIDASAMESGQTVGGRVSRWLRGLLPG